MATTKIIDGDTWQLNPDGRSWVNISAQQRAIQAGKDLNAYRKETGYKGNVQMYPLSNGQITFSAQSAVPYTDNPTTTLPVHSSSTVYGSSPTTQWVPTGESMQNHISVVQNLLKGLPAGTTAASLKQQPISVGGYTFGYDPNERSYYYKSDSIGGRGGENYISDFEIGSGEKSGMFRYGGDWYNQSGQKVQQQSVQPQSSAYSQTSSSTVTGNAQLDQLLNTMKSWVTSLQAQGKVVNPSIEITPEIMKGFLDQAETEIDPYYKSQFSAIKSDLQSNLDYLAKDYELNKQNQQAQFRNQLGLQRENEAEKGTLFSGGRRERVNTLTGAYNRQLQSDELGFLNKTRGLGTTAERSIGSSNISDIKIPTVNSYQARTLGEGDFSTSGTRPLFNPQSGIKGSLEFENLANKRSYASMLEGAYRTKRGLAEQSGTVF